jgi:hypothetical protein
VREFLKDLQRWNSDHEESEANYFHMASDYLSRAHRFDPRARSQNRSLAQLHSFLAGSPMRRESPPEWYTHAKRILRACPT